MSRLCFLIQFHLSPAFNISQRPCHSEKKRQTRYLVLPRVAHKLLNYPPYQSPPDSHPPNHPHSHNLLETSVLLKQALALFPEPGRRKMLSKKNMNKGITFSSDISSPRWFCLFFIKIALSIFFFFCKTCSCWGKKSTGIYSSLVVKNQNPIHMYELLSILVKCH